MRIYLGKVDLLDLEEVEDIGQGLKGDQFTRANVLLTLKKRLESVTTQVEMVGLPRH
jgi:hypothetical protein